VQDRTRIRKKTILITSVCAAEARNDARPVSLGALFFDTVFDSVGRLLV